ncbi:Uu.00g057640.m01.CDS01 [Anthostomella pinea]|uniref:Uu.00g057640.m01.CDS01 n=1 Tax=Anthostomella pinea TaxID=933095 RepID=A0AAI8VSD7_9PEZI|nr:Uu.00g057640.m01.CDS01 [Anthostomella pinea]
MPSHKEGKRPPVPKFSSFKPKLASPPPNRRVETGGESSQVGRDEHPIANRSHSRARDRRRPAADASHKPDTSQLDVPHRPTPQQPELSDLYVVDKRGDSLIRRYGSNDRRRVPEYRRFGSGRILGAVGFMRVDRSGNQEEFFFRGYSDTGSLLSSDRKTLLARGIRPKSQPIRVRREQSQTAAETEDYLPLRNSRKRKRDGNASESSGEEGPSYRSIHGRSRHHEHSDSDELYGSDSSADEMDRSADDPITMRSVDLSRKVREHPENIDSWFELVDHQDTLLQVQSSGRSPTVAEIKSYADIKLSLLQQALSQAKDDSLREKLSLKIMREGAQIWDPKTTSKRWEDAMLKYPKSFNIWKAYVNFRQTSLSTFHYDGIKQLYVDRMRVLGKDISELPPTADNTQPCEDIIYVFLRLTRFIADAGFAELATAAWQASLELSFARPPGLSQPLACEAPSNFQGFWESEVPRIGEDQAQGWATFERNGGVQDPPDPKTAGVTVSPATRDGYKAWSMVEQQHARNATIPARTLDDGAEDDPFRVVMFADIQEILLCLPFGTVPRIQRQLLDAFLIFCQLPPAYCTDNVIHEMINDGFLVRSPVGNLIPEVSPEKEALDSISDQQVRKPPEFLFNYQCMSKTPDVLFSSSPWFRYLRQIQGTIPSDQYLWILTTLKQLSRTFGVKELGPYVLAFESINEPGNEKKSAKLLLKQDSTNIDLYLGYSILERGKDNKAAARNVVSAAMGLSAISSHDRFRLGIFAAWLELEDRELVRSTLRVCLLAEENFSTTSIPEGTVVSSAQILKARQVLASNQDYLVSSGDLANAVVYAEGLALLEYLTGQSGKEPISGSQGDIWSAMSSVSNCSSGFVSRGHGSTGEHEKLLQFAARLLYYHASHGPFRSGFLREQLTQYINFFPQNTIFLSLFAWREERLSIDDRVRSLLNKVVLVESHACIGSHAFAIRHELQTGNAHSTRAAFEHAVASKACKNHPGLWISYIRFCHDRKELREKAKSVFYRAIQSCPWSKDVFMEAFVTLERDMDSAELRSVYNMLCEKGLRVHVEMEEFVEKWRRDLKEKGSGR